MWGGPNRGLQNYGAGHLVTATFGQPPIWPGQNFDVNISRPSKKYASRTCFCSDFHNPEMGTPDDSMDAGISDWLGPQSSSF
jgi:hypothetical protein